MARSYANVTTAIWQDPDFRSLAPGDQGGFFMLITQPNISAAGTLPMTLRRWASMSAGTTVADVQAMMKRLQAARFIAFDEDTEELLVRSFVRFDKGYGNPKRRPAILDAAGEVASPLLRQALAAEFARVGLPTNGLGIQPPPGGPRGNGRPIDSQSIGDSGYESGPAEVDQETDKPNKTPNGATQPVDNAFPQVNSLSIANRASIDRQADWKRSVVTKGPYIDPHSTLHNPHPVPPKRGLSRAARAVVETLGCDDDDGQAIADEIDRRHRPRNLVGYLRTMGAAGDLAPLLAELHAKPPPAVVEPPCGGCGPSRQVQLDDGRIARCPRCHPLRRKVAA